VGASRRKVRGHSHNLYLPFFRADFDFSSEENPQNIVRGEVFAALYSPAGERIWEPFVAPPDELAERLAERSAPPLAGGPGAVRFRAELARCGADVPDDPDPVHRVAARHLCALAAGADTDGALEPIYLRPPDAERWRDRDTSQRSE